MKTRYLLTSLFLASALVAAPAPPKKTAPRPPARWPAVTPVAKPALPRPPTAVKPSPTPPKNPKQDASLAFFREGKVPRLKITIPEPELQRLRQQNREYVRCTVVEEGGRTYENVGIHLKGAAGSFQGVDGKPALTLNFDKFQKDQEYHDLDKIHLNNSVQDPSYLNELVCSELFLAAGVPTPRTTHARVWLNDRDLGFYVLKEGFGRNFLKRHYADPDGNLYEGGFVQDLDGQPKLQNGKGPADRSDVKAVVEACREGDPAKRWPRVARVVDVDRYLTFIALELMTCHWDGYANNRNNYRFYFEPKSGKVHFFPHGMDQMFGDPNFSVLNTPGSIVSQAVLGNPEWRGRYRDRVSELIARHFLPVEKLLKRVDEHHQRLRPALAEMGGGHAAQFDGHVRHLKDRLAARAKSLEQQNAVVEPRPLSFASGAALLTRWEPRKETESARLETPDADKKTAALTIAAGTEARCIASWRTKVLLSAGKYRFEARAKTEDVKALQEGSGTGAGIRVSGSGRTNKLEGTAGWTPLVHDFQIQAPTQEVELVAELRATGGKVTFERSSMRLVRIGG